MPWLSGFQYRKKITLSGSAGAGTNYQVLLKVGESAGSTGADFHVEGHSALFPSGKNDSGDLRFTAPDETTLLDFWIEKVEGASPNRVAYCWVEVSADLGTNQDIYCYYGNSTATNVSNGDNTFLFFDDFSTDTIGTKWQIQDTTNVLRDTATAYALITAGHAKIDSVGNEFFITKTATFSRPFIAEARVKADGFGLYAMSVFINVKGTDLNDYSDQAFVDTDSINLRHAEATMTDYHGTAFTWVAGTYYIISLVATSSQTIAKAYHDNRTYIGDYTLNNAVNNNMNLGLDQYVNGISGTWAYFDWVLVRKYASPEPAFLSAGPEGKLVLGSVLLSGAGNLTTTGKLFLRGTTALSGTGNLSALGGIILRGSALLSGTGSLSAIGNVYKLGQAVLSGIGNLTAKGVGIFSGRATLSGIGSLSALGRLILKGSALLSGIGSLTAQGIKVVLGQVSILGQGLLSAKGTMIYIGKALLLGIGNLNAIGRLKIGYSNKYTKQGDVYSNKYTKQGDVYSNKYTKQGDVYYDKYL